MGLWRRIWPRSGRDIAIDLGTANTLAHVRSKGLVLREPSVVAMDRSRGAVLAVGGEAKRMLGRTPPSIVAVRPLKDGVIADFDVAEAMLRHFVQRALRRGGMSKPTVVVGVPSGVTEVEREAVRNATLRAGARRVLLIDEPMAAAIGAGLPVSEARGSMVVDIGGGTTEVAVIALNGVVTGRSSRIAGDEMDEAIAAYLHRQCSLAIGPATAEMVKIEVGSALAGQGEERTTLVRGRDLLSGLPRAVEVSAAQVREAIAEPLRGLVELLKVALEDTPPELSGDIMDQGIVLTGGGALLPGIDRLIARDTEMPVRVAEDPLTCVVMGAGRALEEAERFAGVFFRPNGHLRLRGA